MCLYKMLTTKSFGFVEALRAYKGLEGPVEDVLCCAEGHLLPCSQGRDCKLELTLQFLGVSAWFLTP